MTATASRTSTSVVRAGRFSVRLHTRSLAVCVLLLAATALVGVLALGTGAIAVAPLDVVRTLLGNGSRLTNFAVLDLRLPRLLTAIAVGAALGLSGAVFQSLTRNPLGSPDVIGFGYGSATGALLVITLFDGAYPGIAGGAVIGGLLTAFVVYVLAWRRGVHGYRLVLVGVGISAILQSVNFYLLVTAELVDAERATVWLTGNLVNRGWDHAMLVAVALLVIVPGTLFGGERLRMLEMGDDAAYALGVPVERTRLGLLVLATAACAVATAAAGPIVFVALTAPQLARRLTRGGGSNLVPAMCMGSLLVSLADFTAQRLTGSLPVGVTTAVIGGVYLGWLLWHQHRTGRA
jgi:iron complex transport system permease protein